MAERLRLLELIKEASVSTRTQVSETNTMFYDNLCDFISGI